MQRRSMGNIYILGSCILLVSILVFYKYPIELNKSYKGIQFKLGTENAGMEERVTVELSGEVRRTVFGKNIFNGKIELHGDAMDQVGLKEQVEFSLGNGYGNGGSISYIDDVTDKVLYFGTMYISDDYISIAIERNEQIEAGSSVWTSENGIVISAPASNREEGLEIANELMKHESIEPFQ
ncbi:MULTISPECIES: hypothetical protein [Bacillaceae]|uniref:LPS export ABC transporter periplasmic protein LptC n=1 Tax=Evansella alkalicola TaxID=745819 RepID=A0ABS6JNP6_9BACI|nr:MULTISPECIES: hypothetical protein [Bacillaceae]MBU9720055.1 hypothetical protein [Bacillus alkalicola]